MIKWIKRLLMLIALILFLFFGIVFRLFLVRLNDFRLQEQYYQRLLTQYRNQEIEIQKETDFLSFDMNEPLRLNEIQMLASHNSYKKTGVPLGRLMVGLGDSFDEAKALKYGYKPLHEQLRLGIRSFEFDVRLRKTAFELTHVPLVDNSSVAPNFSKALDEMLLYTEYHPNHLPIIVLMEVKDDWMLLDHALQKIGVLELIKLNQLIEIKMKDHLYKPSDMMTPGLSLKETIQEAGWPYISDLLGKYIFVLHPGGFTDTYYSIDPSLLTLPMFIGGYQEHQNESFASFIVHNTLDVEKINHLVSEGLIVRTRIDSQLVFNPSDFEKAILSGAQILTSDFLSARSDLPLNQVIYFEGQKTVKRRTTP